MGLGRGKTKSNLVVALSGGGIFAFFCSERDHKPQNSGCGYTAQSFHTAWTQTLRRRGNGRVRDPEEPQAGTA